MNTHFERHMLFKFLAKNFPITRVKHNGRFRRGIKFDDGQVYLCSDKNAMIRLKYLLIDVLRETFLVDDTTCLAVLDNFLQVQEIG